MIAKEISKYSFVVAVVAFLLLILDFMSSFLATKNLIGVIGTACGLVSLGIVIFSRNQQALPSWKKPTFRKGGMKMKLVLIVIIGGVVVTGVVDNAFGIKFVEGTTLVAKMAHWGIYLLWGAVTLWSVRKMQFFIANILWGRCASNEPFFIFY